MNTIPPGLRDVYLLVARDRLSTKLAAARLNIAPDEVEQRLASALVLLASLLDQPASPAGWRRWLPFDRVG